jgi:3-oxoadipate enol-lactonase
VSRRITYVSILIFAAIFAAVHSVGAQHAARTPPGNYLEVEGSKIYYEECGAGPEAVLLIHDGIAHSAVWDDVWPAFCERFHAVRYDRRGYGRSGPADTFYTETDDTFALLRHLKVRRAFVVGSSHGGGLSINFALAHPGMVEELVLVGAVVDGYGYSDHFLARGIENSKPAQKNDTAALISNWVNDRYVFAPGHDTAKKKLRDILTACPQDLTHEDYARPTPPAVPRLHEIRVPTLILTGDADIPDVHAHAGVIESGIPNSRRVVVRDTGHLMYMEKPEEFSRIVIQFLEQNRD